MKQDAYRSYAWSYDRLVEPGIVRLRRVALQLYPPRENIYVLDAGCGTGTQLESYKRPGCKLYGVDASPAMRKIARRKLGDSAELSVQDSSHMTFPDRMFDLILITFVLHEMPASLRPAVLTECQRVLKAEGRILVIDFHFGPYSFPGGYLWRIWRWFMERGAGREHFAYFRDFKKRGGLEPLLAETKLPIDKQVVLPSGAAAVYLLYE
jgi:ubiquinone/menaquinone biosynthesis C-methylase UbiE